jgi:CheY-like chemotaxis protein
MNLVLNASEASARTIAIATGTGPIDPESLVAGEPKPGTYVWIEVEDDGTGMDAATIARVFDPFFTTKFVGRGLGMAAVLGIVRGHDGAIAIASTPGKGTTIRAYFPASAAIATKAGASPLREPLATRRVLLVEDEANVRHSTQMLLEGLGFDVLVARDGVEAVEAFRRDAKRIDAVLLDLAMPRLGGLGALAALRAIAPDVAVVLTSGYGEAPASDDVAVLAKPYTAQQLVDALERVIRR